jgi:hypothetical protein
MKRTALLVCCCLLPGTLCAADAKRAGPDWWSLQPVRRPAVPAVHDRGWPRSPLDAFILAALEARHLRPAPEADRTTLLRRLSFDLLGLPPTPAEIDAFLNDRSPDAYERLVDRLLASPRYGERAGRHWLDVARFGESQGYERDKLRDHAWRYRDYVIQSFNADKPYPRFVQEQLAGDVLPDGGADGVIATGFLVAGPWDEVGNTQQGQVMRRRVREEELEDLVGTVCQTFLGLTVNCARCHSHKFDPIPHRDYYRIKAAFEGIRHGDRPTLPPAALKAREAETARLQRRVDELRQQITVIEDAGRARVAERHRSPGAKDVPAPLARWTFETDARDSAGKLDGILYGGAVVAGGRLRLGGKDAFLRTGPLPRDLTEKTLEAWVALDNLEQRGGGVLTVESENGRVFDGIVFGERQPGKWLAGSDFFRRTADLAGPAETAKPGELVHVAIVYAADNSITCYRNGVLYGSPYTPTGPEATLRTYPAKTSRVLLGLRHTGGGNAFLAGAIEEARLYDRALTAKEVAASFRAGVESVPLADVLGALTREETQRRQQQLDEQARQRAALRELGPVPLAYAANPSQPETTFVLMRGDVEKRGEEVSAGGLSAVRSPSPEFGLAPDAPEAQRRLALARWISDPENPLTARVLVNRVWQYHFGRGLVGTPSDFGFNGERPSHPELLDWLASEFAAPSPPNPLSHKGERGSQTDSPLSPPWERGAGGVRGSIKKLHRLIVLSSTYRQSARSDDEAAAVDTDDRLLWRFAPRRLEGEAVRDAMLAVSGQLNDQLGGPSFRPFTVKVFNSNFYDLTDPIGPEFNRRTVYRMNVNSAKSPLLDALDCPDPSVKAPRRSVTTTPLQALGLMNNAFVQRQARSFAGRVEQEAGGDPAAQVRHAYRLALGRTPSAAETGRAVALVKEHGLESLCWVLFNASEFLYLK